MIAAEQPGTEVWFYHLERRSLEEVLPILLERSLERGWRVVVQAGSEERIAALDTLLWTYREESFLPHGAARDGDPALQPILLTTESDNPNDVEVRFLVDGAGFEDAAGYVRVIRLFDGRDEGAVAQARQDWTRAKAAGHAVSYWREDASGRFHRQT